MTLPPRRSRILRQVCARTSRGSRSSCRAFTPDGAVAAGMLSTVVEPSELLGAARAVAASAAELDLNARRHQAPGRAETLRALRAAIETDYGPPAAPRRRRAPSEAAHPRPARPGAPGRDGSHRGRRGGGFTTRRRRAVVHVDAPLSTSCSATRPAWSRSSSRLPAAVRTSRPSSPGEDHRADLVDLLQGFRRLPPEPGAPWRSCSPARSRTSPRARWASGRTGGEGAVRRTRAAGDRCRPDRGRRCRCRARAPRHRPRRGRGGGGRLARDLASVDRRWALAIEAVLDGLRPASTVGRRARRASAGEDAVALGEQLRGSRSSPAIPMTVPHEVGEQPGQKNRGPAQSWR